ncbi:MAG TPA: hypothetical protein VGM64_21805 [Lacunisphaera sp.]|jgi:hypothetical protein
MANSKATPIARVAIRWTKKMSDEREENLVVILMKLQRLDGDEPSHGAFLRITFGGASSGGQWLVMVVIILKPAIVGMD